MESRKEEKQKYQCGCIRTDSQRKQSYRKMIEEWATEWKKEIVDEYTDPIEERGKDSEKEYNQIEWYTKADRHTLACLTRRRQPRDEINGGLTEE